MFAELPSRGHEGSLLLDPVESFEKVNLLGYGELLPAAVVTA